ncbi:MAG: hypothetical protein RR500_07925 [Bacilli bacterium]
MNIIYNKLLLNILLFNYTLNNEENKSKYLNNSLLLLKQININEIDSLKSIFPLIDGKKTINNFIKEVVF